MTLLNGKLNSKRFLLALIGYCGTMAAAVAKNWLPGIDNTLVITAVGLITAFITAQSIRPSGPEIQTASASREPQVKTVLFTTEAPK
jgi:hypothetical protein